jgi:hypothetical protein
MNSDFKIKYINILIGVLLILVVFIGVYNYYEQKINERDYGCWVYHVQECLDCHHKNLTYALCSGFCFEPRESDLSNNSMDIHCSIHPSENCFDLPKQCNLD